jgi:hypothetical protein
MQHMVRAVRMHEPLYGSSTSNYQPATVYAERDTFS